MDGARTAAAGPREQLEAFEALLRDEHEALLEADYDRLARLTRKKTDLLAALNAELGGPDGAAAESYLQGLAESPELRQRLLRAREANRVNGRLIAGAMHYVEDALAALRGESADAYDAHGRAGPGCSGQVPLGRA